MPRQSRWVDADSQHQAHWTITWHGLQHGNTIVTQCGEM